MLLDDDDDDVAVLDIKDAMVRRFALMNSVLIAFNLVWPDRQQRSRNHVMKRFANVLHSHTLRLQTAEMHRKWANYHIKSRVRNAIFARGNRLNSKLDSGCIVRFLLMDSFRGRQ